MLAGYQTLTIHHISKETTSDRTRCTAVPHETQTRPDKIGSATSPGARFRLRVRGCAAPGALPVPLAGARSSARTGNTAAELEPSTTHVTHEPTLSPNWPAISNQDHDRRASTALRLQAATRGRARIIPPARCSLSAKFICTSPQFFICHAHWRMLALSPALSLKAQ